MTNSSVNKLLISVTICLVVACQPKSASDFRFKLLSPNLTDVFFNNEIKITDEFNVLSFDYIYNGGGVAIGDFNGDGLPDLFFTGNMVSCALYLNEGDLKFKEATSEAGLITSSWAEGVTLVDINQDGLLDIYVSVSNRDDANPNPNLLFVNQGNDENGVPKFLEKAAAYGIDDRGYNTQAAFFDYDGDGYLDLYVLSNALESFQRNTSRPREKTGKGKSNDKLYRNNGDGTFSNVTREAGILTEGYGLGLAITDINKDGWPDIYVANDFITNDLLYINNGDGTFSNEISKRLDHQSFNAMGVDVTDFNNDGWSDVIVLDMFPPDNLRQKTMFAPTENYDLYTANLERGYEPQYVRNTLQLNRGDGYFSEIGFLANVFETDWSWAPLFADLDNDGFRDLFVSNGYGKDITDLDYINFSQNLGPFSTPENRRALLLEGIAPLKEVKLPNYVFKNNRDFTFEDVSELWGIREASISNGVAYADLDLDGDLDLVINNLNQEAFIYQNMTMEGLTPDRKANYVKFILKGEAPNKQGLGAKLTLTYMDQGNPVMQYYEHFPTRGYKSYVDETIHFGLGEVDTIDRLDILWPGGELQRFENLPVNSLHTLLFDLNKTNHRDSSNIILKHQFEEVSDQRGIAHRHLQHTYKDFNRQRLLPHKHSENGPGLAVGDINGDGREDFVVGGNVGYPAQVFIQDGRGNFKAQNLSEAYDSDDMGLLLFDIEGDGDLDLYVVSGGSRFQEGDEHYQDRIYLNDGKGNFAMASDILPELNFSGSVVTAADFDGDGNVELFIGGRVRPGQYPLSPRSAILKSKEGKLMDVTEEVCPDLADLGMVTAALWTDFDQDGRVDLIVVGEWMPVRFFKNELLDNGHSRLVDVSDTMAPQNSSGWWNSILQAGFDENEKPIYILGNLGLNVRWKATPEEPLSIYAKDFDGNGSVDPIMFQYLKGEKHAVPGRDALVSQIPSWKNRFLIYSDYAKVGFDGFFRPEDQEGMESLHADYFESATMTLGDDGKFSLRALPMQAQFAPIYGMLHNQDRQTFLIGNFFGNETITGRYDAFRGLQLVMEESKRPKVVEASESGFEVSGQGRGLAEILLADGQKAMLVAQQADSLKLFVSKDQTMVLRFLQPQSNIQKAIIQLQNGKSRIHEFHHGSGYLSQSSRALAVSEDFMKVTFVDYSGRMEVVYEKK